MLKNTIYGLLAFLMLSISSGCTGQKETGTRPYNCGFILSSRKQVEKVCRPEIEVLQPKAGDVIASVGASNGFRAGMLSVLTDSLTFYLEDIDESCLNEEEVKRVWKWYGKVRGTPLTNRYKIVIGTETETRLPDHTFDKIVVSAAFHHFSDQKAMLDDLKKKLKKEGKLYIIENVVKNSGEVRKKTCRHPLLSEADLRKVFEDNGFEVSSVHELHRWWTKMLVLEPK